MGPVLGNRLPTSSTTGSSRFGRGPVRPTSTTVIEWAPRPRTQPGSKTSRPRSGSWNEPTRSCGGQRVFRGGTRPPTPMIVEFIDTDPDEFGVESICTTRPTSTYYAAKRRQREVSTRAISDAQLMPVLVGLWVANRKVCGARKLWKATRRAGHEIGRDPLDARTRHRRGQGWRVATHMQTSMVLDAVEMARRSRGSRRLVRPGRPLRRQIPIHLDPVHRTSRRDRRPALHRYRGRLPVNRLGPRWHGKHDCRSTPAAPRTCIHGARDGRQDVSRSPHPSAEEPLTNRRSGQAKPLGNESTANERGGATGRRHGDGRLARREPPGAHR